MAYVPKHRAETEEDRMRMRMCDVFDRADERAKAKYRPFEKPHCQSFCAGDHMVGCPDGTAYYDLVADELTAALAEPTPHEADGGEG